MSSKLCIVRKHRRLKLSSRFQAEVLMLDHEDNSDNAGFNARPLFANKCCLNTPCSNLFRTPPKMTVIYTTKCHTETLSIASD